VIEPVTSVVLRKNCGLYPDIKGVCLQPSSFFNTYTSASNLLFVFTVPGLHNTCHLSISSLSTHLNNNPTFIPASALSKDL